MQIDDIVTLGYGLYDVEVEAWITFPAKDVTHEIDPIKSSESNTQWRQIKSPTKQFEKLTVPSVRRPKPLKGKLLELRETDWGGEMALIDLGNRHRWFNTCLINNPPLESPPKRQ